jgi:HD-like signal output (HDOD) protein
MSASSTKRLGSALDTGLYTIDPQAPQDTGLEHPEPTPRRIEPVGKPRDLRGELRRRVSTLLDQGDFEPPRLPEIAVEVMRRAEDQRVSAEEMAALIHRDPFLAGRLLAAANSAMFRPRDRAVTRLPEAVTRLGTRQVRNTILAAALEQTIYRGPRRGLMNELWQASLGAAVGCRLLATPQGQDPDRAFMLGLLHDVGKPVLCWCLDRVLREGQHSDFDSHFEAISHQLHPMLGARIVEHWRLPRALAGIIAHHHDHDPPEGLSREVKQLRIANLLYQCWRDSPGDFDEGGMLHHHHLLVRSLREPPLIQHLLQRFPPSLETLLVG